MSPEEEHKLLESWAEGNGNEYQRNLGLLARHYRMVHTKETK